MRRDRSHYSTEKKKIRKFRPGIFLMNLLLIFLMTLILDTCLKYLHQEISFRRLEQEQAKLYHEIETLEKEIDFTQSPDFLEIMARQMDMVKDGEYVIILPVEK